MHNTITCLDELLDQMMIESIVDSVHYSNKLEGIEVPLDRCYELCIGTFDSED